MAAARRRTLLLATVVAAICLAGAAVWAAQRPSGEPSAAAPISSATERPSSEAVPGAGAAGLDTTGTALAAAAGLTVAGSDPFDGYDRDLYAWRGVDLDRNGCDSRNDVLRRDLTELAIREGTNGCLVETGTLADPYTGATIDFTRGSDTSDKVQIDHVVALANSWVSGAQGWDRSTFESFGNDPLNLLAVDGPANQSKGAGDASEWLPPNEAFWCEYVARQVAVKTAYALTVTPSELGAIESVLAGCPDEPLPTAADTVTP